MLSTETNNYRIKAFKNMSYNFENRITGANCISEGDWALKKLYKVYLYADEAHLTGALRID